jgi:hypothetical protein
MTDVLRATDISLASKVGRLYHPGV